MVARTTCVAGGATTRVHTILLTPACSAHPSKRAIQRSGSFYVLPNQSAPSFTGCRSQPKSPPVIISILEVVEFGRFGRHSIIACLPRSVASRADGFIRQHIPSQKPLSSLVLFPAAQDHCSIDFPSPRQVLRQALFRTTPLGDLQLGQDGLTPCSYEYKAEYGRILMPLPTGNSTFLSPLLLKLQNPRYHPSNNNSLS